MLLPGAFVPEIWGTKLREGKRVTGATHQQSKRPGLSDTHICWIPGRGLMLRVETSAWEGFWSAVSSPHPSTQGS